MSSRRRHLILKPQARLDVKEILLHTREHWGTAQRSHYKAQIDRILRDIIAYPESGRSRDDLYAGCRTRLVEQHVIYYHLTDSEIVVSRVLHGHQDPAGRVES